MVIFPSVISQKSKPEKRYINIDVCAVVNDAKEHRKVCVSDALSSEQLEFLLPELPKAGESMRFLSGRNGFSAGAFIEHIAKKEIIEELCVLTFRLSPEIASKIGDLADKGRIKDAFFIVGNLKRMDTAQYNYFEQCQKIFDTHGWTCLSIDNHAKIWLFKTKKNHYIVETSANLNKLTNIEVFCFLNDAGVWEFYRKFFDAFSKRGADHGRAQTETYGD